jgi:hypothetical protein
VLHQTPDAAATLGRAGGRRRSIVVRRPLVRFQRAETAKQMTVIVSQTILEMRAGLCDPRTGAAIAAAAGVFFRGIDMTVVDERISRLEATFAEMKKEGRATHHVQR